LASGVVAVGFGWAIFAGWDDMPAVVMIPVAAASVVIVVMSVREIAGRVMRRRSGRVDASSGD
jgi:hypothetical protein